uniref:3CxxC-type domain-containing protein n=1 Tax=Taeniopygia guttata TaxID=59729 RepID=A0A674HL60_TAEGU
MCIQELTWQSIFAVKMEEMHITDPWTLLEDDALQVQACGPGWKEFVQRHALGRFQCSQCFYSWSSAKVHILFHMCHCQGWGTVLMRIFRQKCRRCRNSQLEDPDFSLDTVETILHNLVIKILQYFYKKPVQPSDLLEVVVDTPVTGPHEHAHCEACELGICSRAQRAPALDAWKSLMDEDKARMHSIESGLSALPLASWVPCRGGKGCQTWQVQEGCNSKSKVYAPVMQKLQVLDYRVWAKMKM